MTSTLSDPIVVTGMGAVTPLGVGVDTNWQRLTAGQSGIRLNDRFDVSGLTCKIAGLVPTKAADPSGFDPLDFVDAKDLKKMDVFIQYGLGAAAEAIAQAGWQPSTDAERESTATIIASGVGGFPNMTDAALTVKERGARRLSPFIVPSFLANLAAGWVSIRHGFRGPLGTPVTACAAAAQAIGDGMRLIRTGEAEVAVVGGAEGSIDPVTIGGFAAARALATSFNDRPQAASRPLDKARDGFVLAEGAAILVIEKLSHALARGARPLAILAGYGTSADAYHLTASPPDGEGAQRAMRLALKMGGVSSADVGYLNAHIELQPTVASDALDPGHLPLVVRTAGLVAVPWPLLALLVIGFAVWYLRRARRSRDARRVDAWVARTEELVRERLTREAASLGEALGGGSEAPGRPAAGEMR